MLVSLSSSCPPAGVPTPLRRNSRTREQPTLVGIGVSRPSHLSINSIGAGVFLRLHVTRVPFYREIRKSAAGYVGVGCTVNCSDERWETLLSTHGAAS